jgi:hypothetical protein
VGAWLYIAAVRLFTALVGRPRVPEGREGPCPAEGSTADDTPAAAAIAAATVPPPPSTRRRARDEGLPPLTPAGATGLPLAGGAPLGWWGCCVDGGCGEPACEPAEQRGGSKGARGLEKSAHRLVREAR